MFGISRLIVFLKRVIIFVLSLDKYILYKIYNFDKWHSQIIYGDKYTTTVISYINSLKANSIVEIGCGLGDILLKINVSEKTGLDQSQEVLNAASFIFKLKFKKAVFKKFDFINDSLQNKYDVILLVNWPHTIDEKILKKKIETMFNDNLSNYGTIIIDTFTDESYTYNHDINFLTRNITCDVTKIGEHINGTQHVWKISK